MITSLCLIHDSILVSDSNKFAANVQCAISISADSNCMGRLGRKFSSVPNRISVARNYRVKFITSDASWNSQRFEIAALTRNS